MEEDKQEVQSLRVSRLRQSYTFATHSLLKACSKEEFLKIVSSFKQSYQETLYQLYLKIIASMHENIQDEFESICQETQVMAALGTIEQLIENKKFDVLHEDNTSVNDVKQEIAKRKLCEIHYLKNMLEKVQEQNEKDEKYLEVLRKSVDDLPNANSAVSKLKECNGTLQQASQSMKSL
ncbi:hypothetical protein SUGI_1028330 [Cryptomeria japonica]|uniref:uncharacterized protein LOC131041778 n=1 Tax=Cryptomeria japonica TaxID=3369 RepID=UPI00241494F3|nr:uncharacterized protein LOC131041778 [Cryptomeria japonica]XP_057830968.2 uncharacterized protein LOC131041778 [Cryptomeria japonica]XP_057830969.2 uncharacterized protein LOC131041778 [Cryptomeria japonica]GLJ48759.1 hypothetical protein SUGI_1028330 [Cryptomeria japonica]